MPFLGKIWLLVTMAIMPGFTQVELINKSVRLHLDFDGSAPPRLTSFVDFTNNIEVQSDLLNFHCGTVADSGQWHISEQSTTKLVIKGNSSCYPGLTAKLSYWLMGRELLFEGAWTAEHPVEIQYGYSAFLGSSLKGIAGRNHLGNSTWYASVDTVPVYVQQNQYNKLAYANTDTLNLFFPNPFHAFLRMDSLGNKDAWWDVLPYIPAYSRKSGEGSWSQVVPGDTIVRQFRVSVGAFPLKRIYISEHATGHDHSLTMYLDELPGRENWNPPTTHDDPKTPLYRQFVKLLERFPDLKLGLLLLTDRDLERAKSSFDGWTVTSPAILADTLEKGSEDPCIHMMGLTDSSHLELTQTLNVDGRDSIRVTVSYKRDSSATGKLSACARIGRWVLSCHELAGAANKWKSDTLAFGFPPGAQQVDLVFISSGKGWFWLDDVYTLPVGLRYYAVANGRFDKYDAAFLFDNKRRHFSDVHGKEYVPNAPKAYLDFLRRIDRGESVYGWEKQVRLGFHGLKHSPNFLEPDPGHEFMYYDPVGDSLRLKRIREQFHAIGLSDRSLRFVRPPGWQSSRSLLHQLVEMDVIWIDLGWWSQHQANSAGFIRRGGKTLWGRSSDWWMDRTPDGWGLSHWDLQRDLNIGHLIHLGGHPEPMMSYKGSLEAHIQFFDSLKNSFPHMDYVFPDDYAERAIATQKLLLRWSEPNGKLLLQVDGKMPEGITLILENYSSAEAASAIAAMPGAQWRKAGDRYYVWNLGSLPTLFVNKQLYVDDVDDFDVMGRKGRALEGVSIDKATTQRENRTVLKHNDREKKRYR